MGFTTPHPQRICCRMLLVITCLLPSLTKETDFFLEAEVRGSGRFKVAQRSNASSGKTVRLETVGDSVTISFCLRQPSGVEVLETSYSNDGGSENVTVVIDSFLIGTFSSVSQSNYGRLWNVFLASPPLSVTALNLGQGQHNLSLSLLQPSDGVEIDTIHVRFSDSRLSRDILECLLHCLSTLPSIPPNEVAGGGKMRMRQASYPTKCAEEDNVKVPLYLRDVTEFTITADSLAYVGSPNRRDPDHTDCPYLAPDSWVFTNLLLTPVPETSTHVTSNGTLYIRGGPMPVLRIEFYLRGQSDGFVDASMGSVLTIRIENSTRQVSVKVAYSGRSRKLTSMPDVVFQPGEVLQTLQFPDFIWLEHEANILQLTVQSLSSGDIRLSEIKLERRPMLGETIRKVFDSSQVVIEAVDVDFWWREPELMLMVNGDTGQNWGYADFFRIALHVPWNGGYAEVFVMYQDGNVRLLPLPPPGMDWIPFGTSVLLGHNDPDHLRPVAPISEVIISPSSLVLHITYSDGGSAKLKLVTDSFKKIVAIVNDIKFSGTSKPDGYPFATVRSMYIEEGNTDSDSILVDGKVSYPVLGDWATVEGTSFLFFRRCESKHLTLSPNIRIDVTKSGVYSRSSRDNISSNRLIVMEGVLSLLLNFGED